MTTPDKTPASADEPIAGSPEHGSDGLKSILQKYRDFWTNPQQDVLNTEQTMAAIQALIAEAVHRAEVTARIDELGTIPTGYGHHVTSTYRNGRRGKPMTLHQRIKELKSAGEVQPQ